MPSVIRLAAERDADQLLEIYIQGKATYVYDSNTGATLEITLVGTTTDICAAIS